MRMFSSRLLARVGVSAALPGDRAVGGASPAVPWRKAGLAFPVWGCRSFCCAVKDCAGLVRSAMLGGETSMPRRTGLAAFAEAAGLADGGFLPCRASPPGLGAALGSVLFPALCGLIVGLRPASCCEKRVLAGLCCAGLCATAVTGPLTRAAPTETLFCSKLCALPAAPCSARLTLRWEKRGLPAGIVCRDMARFPAGAVPGLRCILTGLPACSTRPVFCTTRSPGAGGVPAVPC